MDNTIMELNKKNIEDMIYVVSGMKVMLDFDLARIYGYETKYLNRQVNNNIVKFPNRYRFQLMKKEFENIQRCKNFTSGIWASGTGGRAYLPYAFTEQGVYMLMTVLKGDLATKQSIALIDAFKQMKDYIICNDGLTNSPKTIPLADINTLANKNFLYVSSSSCFNLLFLINTIPVETMIRKA